MNDHEDCHVSYDYGIVLRHRHLLRSLTIHGQFSSRVSFVEYFWGRTAVLRLARFVMANSLMPHTYVWRRYVVNWHLKVTQSSKNQKVVEHVPINKGNKQERSKRSVFISIRQSRLFNAHQFVGLFCCVYSLQREQLICPLKDKQAISVGL